jgi:hypothetical protein
MFAVCASVGLVIEREALMALVEGDARKSDRPADVEVRPHKTSVAPGSSLHLEAFFKLLPAVMRSFRGRRMRMFTRLMHPKPGARVVDLGGAPEIWEHVPTPLDITILNLPGSLVRAQPTNHHRFTYVEGDACDVRQFGKGSFDIAFSNSVIEHVGPPDKQQAFAREVARLAPSFWVQTPSAFFPIEAHSGMPFYWFYPDPVRQMLLERWKRKFPSWWYEYISSTRVLSRDALADFFPGAQLRTEFFMGFPKSYIAYSA